VKERERERAPQVRRVMHAVSYGTLEWCHDPWQDALFCHENSSRLIIIVVTNKRTRESFNQHVHLHVGVSTVYIILVVIVTNKSITQERPPLHVVATARPVATDVNLLTDDEFGSFQSMSLIPDVSIPEQRAISWYDTKYCNESLAAHCIDLEFCTLRDDTVDIMNAMTTMEPGRVDTRMRSFYDQRIGKLIVVRSNSSSDEY
jgi:hypothetical protein